MTGMTPLLLFGIWDSILGFLDTLMTPIYAAVSGILVGAYHLLSPIFGEGSGLSWALGIVALTVVIRTLLIPLFVKQINSARNMQLLQPKVKALQEKYGADRERLGQETMKLYQAEGVNPMASCFPLLLQMPIFIGLFNVLNAAARGQAKGYFFEQQPQLVQSMMDASLFGARLAGTAFPFTPFGATQILALLLVAGMTAILFVTQLQLMSKNMPPEALSGPFAQQQKMMLYLFPVIYAVTGVSIPIGVLVYWMTSNLWTLAQQYYIIHNNPTPNTPAYLAWEDRMKAKGLDPRKLEAERIAKRTGRKVAAPEATPTADAAADGQGTARPQVQRQQVQRQQPRNQSRSARRRPAPGGGMEQEGAGE